MDPGHAYDPVQMVKMGPLLGSCVWFTKPVWGARGMTSLLRQNTEAPGCRGRAREKVGRVPSPERAPDVPSPAQ